MALLTKSKYLAGLQCSKLLWKNLIVLILDIDLIIYYV